MRTILPGFATLSEFVTGLHGDCGPTATLAALHCLDPARWPLTPAGLRALDADEIGHGFAEANGAQNIPALSAYLDRIGVRHTTYGYGACPLDLVHSTLKALAGRQPIIVEWANAGALPGDEPGVRFHYSTCGGIDTGPKGDGVGGGYLWCDGDNRADDAGGAPRPPVLYTWAQIVAAQPIAMIVLDMPTQQQTENTTMAFHKQPDGTGRDDHGNACGAGFMADLLARNETADGRMSETYVSGAQTFKSFLPLTNGDVLVWDGAHVTHDGALVAAELYRLLVAARTAAPQQPPAPMPAPAPAPDPVAVEAKAALVQLKKTLADL